MKLFFKIFLLLVFSTLSVIMGFVTWHTFSIIHFFVLDSVGDYREMRGDGVRPAYWKDFMSHIWPYAIPAFSAFISFVFASISSMLAKSILCQRKNRQACAEKHDRYGSSGSPFLVLLVLFATTILTGCGDKENSSELIGDRPEVETRQKNENVADSSDQSTEKAEIQGEDSSIYDQMSPSLRKSLMQLRGDGPKIPIMLKAWSELWQGRFDEPAAEDAISSIRSQAPDSIMALLQSGGTLEGFKRIDLAAIGGLYIGWANDQNLSGQLYYLLRKRSDALPQSEGDAFMSVFSDEMIQVIEPPIHFEEEDVEGWEKVAKGKNPAYRRIALKIHERLSSNIGIRESFLKQYSHETEKNIKEEALVQISGLPEEPRKRLLEIFRDGQSSIGDLDFSRKIQTAIDQ